MKEWSLIKTEHRTGDYCMRCMRVLEAIYDTNKNTMNGYTKDSALFKEAQAENKYLRRVIWLLEDEGYLEEMEDLWL